MTHQGEAPAEQPEYVLGTNPTELQRLGFQHRLWSRSAHELWARADIAPAQAILDVGCGPGFAALDLAQIVGPTGRVVGIDESEPFIAFANDQAQLRQLPHASFFAADAAQLDAIEQLEPASFDIAYLRWVLCFVPDPQAVITAVARCLKPGGRLLVQDYFRYESMCVAPRSEPFELVIAAIAKSWRDHGGDPDIMGTLPTIALDADLTIDHLARMEVGTARPGTTMWNWPDTFWRVFLPRLEELGYITKSQYTEFLTLWAELSKSPAVYMHLPPMYELIARK
jgi:SAM-dependent methyltransferase